MSANLALFLCPGCGAALLRQPGEPLTCLRCGPLPPIAAPAGLPLELPRPPRSLLRSAIPVWMLGLGLFVLLAMGALVAGLCWSMQARSEAQAVVWANQLVAARMDTARAHMSQNRWDEAIRTLQEALTIEKATCRDEVLALLDQAEVGQADALLVGAREATLHRQPEQARQLLHAYRRHPRAAEPEVAAALEEEIDHAVSEVEARRWLSQLSEAALEQLSGADAPSEALALKDAGARAIFLDTARKVLPAELRRREGLRQAAQQEAALRQAQRRRQEARLRTTAEFRRLADFVASTRKQYQQHQELARRQEEALGLLYRQLDIGNAAERRAVRQELVVEGGFQRTLEDALAVRRGEAKQACRRSAGLSAADVSVFDEMVDEEVDGLLREMTSR